MIIKPGENLIVNTAHRGPPQYVVVKFLNEFDNKISVKQADGQIISFNKDDPKILGIADSTTSVGQQFDYVAAKEHLFKSVVREEFANELEEAAVLIRKGEIVEAHSLLKKLLSSVETRLSVYRLS